MSQHLHETFTRGNPGGRKAPFLRVLGGSVSQRGQPSFPGLSDDGERGNSRSHFSTRSREMPHAQHMLKVCGHELAVGKSNGFREVVQRATGTIRQQLHHPRLPCPLSSACCSLCTKLVHQSTVRLCPRRRDQADTTCSTGWTRPHSLTLRMLSGTPRFRLRWHCRDTWRRFATALRRNVDRHYT